MKNKIYIQFLMACLFLMPLGVFSQSNLSLNKAILIGLENNFKIRLSKQNLTIAANNNSWGNTGLYPNFSLGVDNNNGLGDIYSSSNPNRIGNSQLTKLDANIRMNYTLFKGFAVFINKQVFENLEELSQGNVDLIVESNVQAIILSYYDVLVQQEKLQVFEEVKQLSFDRYLYQSEQKDLGVSVTFDVLQTKDAWLADSTNFLNQALSLRKAKNRLNILLGNAPNANYTLTDELNTNFPSFDLKSLVENSLKSNKNLVNQFTNLRLKALASRNARTNLYPRLNMNAGGGHSIANQNLFQSDQTHEESLNYYVNFSLSFNLYNGGSTRRAIKNARVNEDIAALQIDELKYEIESEVITQFDLYQIRQNLVSTNQLAMETSNMNLNMAKELYQNGSINSFNYRDIQLGYLNSSINKLQSIYNTIVTQLEILRLSGNVISYTE